MILSSIILIIVFSMIAYGITYSICFFRYRGKETDADNADVNQRTFFWRSFLILWSGFMISVPLMNRAISEFTTHQKMDKNPIISAMRYYQPDLYLSLAEKLDSGLSSKDKQAAIQGAIVTFRNDWVNKVPYANSDAMMRYVRYRYNESAYLHKKGMVNCADHSDQLTQLKNDFMLNNAISVRDAMQATVKINPMEIPLSSIEKRYGDHRIAEIKRKIQEQAPDISEKSCQFYEDFYLALLSYPDEILHKIIRTLLLSKTNI